MSLKNLGFDRLAVWKRAASPLLLPGAGTETRDELRARLIADFQRARYGVICRTLSFPAAVEGENVHYRALAVTAALDQWIVQRVAERAMQAEQSVYPVATPNADVAVVKTGLGFFDALEHLARYERTQDREPCGESRDALGNDHYEAFGLLHDIVTDMQGMPQPTIGGHPVTSGQFPQTGLKALETFRKKDALKTELAQQALRQSHKGVDTLLAGFEEFRRRKNASDDVAKASALANAWVSLFQKLQGTDRRQLAINYHQTGPLDEIIKISRQQIYAKELWLFCWDWSFKSRMQSLYDVSMVSVDSMKGLEKGDRKLIRELLRDMYEIGLVEDGKTLMDIASTNKPCEKDPLEMLEELATQYAKLSSFELKLAGRKRFMARVLGEPARTGLPDHILTIAGDLGALCNARAAEAQEANNLIKPARIVPGRVEISRHL